MSALEAQHMIDSVDRDGNDTLNFDEFIVLMSRGAKRGGPLERAVDNMFARVRSTQAAAEASSRRAAKALSPKGGSRPSTEASSLRAAFSAIDAAESGEIEPVELIEAMAAMSAEKVTGWVGKEGGGGGSPQQQQQQ